MIALFSPLKGGHPVNTEIEERDFILWTKYDGQKWLFEHWASFLPHSYNCLSLLQHSPTEKFSIIIQNNKLHLDYEYKQIL